MNLPMVRMASHPHDPAAALDHPHGFGGHVPHTHVIKEAWKHEDKQALADHIDRHHAPVDHVRHEA